MKAPSASFIWPLGSSRPAVRGFLRSMAWSRMRLRPSAAVRAPVPATRIRRSTRHVSSPWARRAPLRSIGNENRVCSILTNRLYAFRRSCIAIVRNIFDSANQCSLESRPNATRIWSHLNVSRNISLISLRSHRDDETNIRCYSRFGVAGDSPDVLEFIATKTPLTVDGGGQLT